MPQCAFLNTMFTLSAAVICGFVYHTPEGKVKVGHFIEGVVNVIVG